MSFRAKSCFAAEIPCYAAKIPLIARTRELKSNILTYHAIKPARHRRGLGREALGRVVEIAERDFGLDLLIARMRADNVPAMLSAR